MNLLWDSPTAILSFVFGFFLLVLIQSLSCRKLDPREPPVVRLTIPYLGALIGMVVQGGKYLKNLAIRTKDPIFTVPVPGGRMYIVTDPALAAMVQRCKTLSFNPIIPEATQRILGLDKETVEIVKTNLNRENNVRGFIPELHDMIYANMAPGESLDDLSTQAAKELTKLVQTYAEDLQGADSNGKVEDLLLWAEHIVTIATARFLYGPNNPIDVDPQHEADFWDFDRGIGLLLVNVLPSITARKAFKGREALAASLAKYIHNGHESTASPLIQQRIKIALKHGFTVEMLGRAELSFLFAGIVNTAITSFWLILHIFARPSLLEEVRNELEATFGRLHASDLLGKIDATKLRNECPLFMSIYRETLRVGSETSSTRVVMEETILADRYWLKKDSVLQIVGGAMHVDKSIWGPNAEEFDPYRFLDTKEKKQEKIHPAAYRAFGGGATLCPGRHFATNEITCFVALVIMLFDIESLDGSTLQIPKKRDNVLPVHILEPVKDVKCRISLRA